MATKKRSGPDRQVYCFVPSEEIDIVVLAIYIKSYIDGNATIKPSHHPNDRDRLGFTIGASSTLGREALEDLIQDSKEWEKETTNREFEDDPYDYQESDTWARRKRLGPSPARRARVIEGQRQPATMPGRHDPKNPGTLSDMTYSTGSTQQSSIFSRGAAESRSLSTLSEDTLAPSDSASQVQYSTSYGQGGGGKKPPPPKPGPNQPRPDAYQPRPDSYQPQLANLSISDNTRPNQGAQRQQTTSKDRHAPDPRDNQSSNKAGAKSNNRKDQLYDDTYH